MNRDEHIPKVRKRIVMMDDDDLSILAKRGEVRIDPVGRVYGLGEFIRRQAGGRR